VGDGKGYWVGAPGAFYDDEDKAFYLTYRVRRPRGVEPDRGGEAFIARSSDGLNFEDVLRVTKGQFDSTSIERCALHRGEDGSWRYFLSYVAPENKRWCVAVIQAPSVEELDPANVQRVFTSTDLGLEGVKDPWITRRSDKFVMVLSVATSVPETSENSHSTADIYNTGECRSASALASSDDLDHWHWDGLIFEPTTDGWDSYGRRINSFFDTGDRVVAFYDGSDSHLKNYEEQTGFAESSDLNHWKTLTPDGPSLVSPHASGALRYIDALTVGDKIYLYYEFAREDGSHDLRVVRMGRSEITF
jgi:hypothetical protein